MKASLFDQLYNKLDMESYDLHAYTATEALNKEDAITEG